MAQSARIFGTWKDPWRNRVNVVEQSSVYQPVRTHVDSPRRGSLFILFIYYKISYNNSFCLLPDIVAFVSFSDVFIAYYFRWVKTMQELSTSRNAGSESSKVRSSVFCVNSQFNLLEQNAKGKKTTKKKKPPCSPQTWNILGDFTSLYLVWGVVPSQSRKRSSTAVPVQR